MDLWQDARVVWNCFKGSLRHRGLVWLGRVLTLVVLTGFVLFPRDSETLQWIQGSGRWEHIAEFLGVWGDYLPFNIGLGMVLLIGGVLRKDRWLRRGALAFILAGCLSGATTRMVKMSAGRARPNTVEQNELHYLSFKGPTLSGKYHGYFSGHTSATMAGAVVLAILFPRVGWLVVLFAGVVGWSRIYGNYHFPTDVIHGGVWGVMWGSLVGTGLKRGKEQE